VKSRAWTGVKHAAWVVPALVTFSDLAASVLQVKGESMQPTLNGDPDICDWVLVEKLTCKWLYQYERGSVVVLWAPDNPHQQLVKRLVALEGDLVWQDGKAKPTQIPQGRCWIEGDNKAVSQDSTTVYGPVHLGLMEGRVTHVVWPPGHWRRVASYVPKDRVVEQDITRF